MAATFIKVESTAGERYILHLGFQTANEKKMVYRMAEYHAILLRKFDLPIKQFVIYFGEKPPKMTTQLPPEKVFIGFTLKNMTAFRAASFLDSEDPEEVIMAPLGNLEGEPAKEIIRSTIRRLQEVTSEPAILNKYLSQLIILAGLRKLECVSWKKKPLNKSKIWH